MRSEKASPLPYDVQVRDTGGLRIVRSQNHVRMLSVAVLAGVVASVALRLVS